MNDKKKNITAGDESVVMGTFEGDVNAGKGVVIIGSTDNEGNTILNEPMTVGHNAHGNSNSITIGANATTSSGIFQLLNSLKSNTEIQNDAELLSKVAEIISELGNNNPNPNKIKPLWNAIKTAVTMGNAANLVGQITTILSNMNLF